MIASVVQRFAFVLCAVVVGVFFASGPALAHDVVDRSVTLEIQDEHIMGSAYVAFEQLGFKDTSGDSRLDKEEMDAQKKALSSSIVASVREHVTITVDGKPTEIVGAGLAPIDIVIARKSVKHIAMRFVTGPHDGDVSEIAIEWKFDSPSNEAIVAYQDGTVVSDLSEDGTASFSLDVWSALASFFVLGIDHIRFGLDHLLFLLVLTLAVVGTTVSKTATWRTTKLVTAFTLGHATSLCLAYFNVVSVPAGIVEPAISLSIVAGAVLVIWGRSSDARWWIVSLVGLLHGLGFASSLGSLGVATSKRAPALAAFNVGIDVAQLAVALMVICVLWVASKLLRDRIDWVRIPVAAGAGIAGIVWTVGRVF